MLRDVAKRDGVTLSEFLEKRLRDEWREVQRVRRVDGDAPSE
jgi:Fe-S cluster biogenesis protein NfuA